MSPKGYIIGLLLSTLLLVSIIKLGYTSSARCDAFSTSPDQFMAYCDSSKHGHYDHAAYLYNLEDGIYDAVRRANVLFLGSSRMQESFSTTALTTLTMQHPSLRPYLLGFGYKEQDKFSAAVLRRIRPSPKLVVINTDPFFSNTASPHATALLDNPSNELLTALTKKLWHGISARACHGKLPVIGKFICGPIPTTYRSRTDGRWIWRTERIGKIPASYPMAEPRAAKDVTRYAKTAEEFLKLLPVERRCIVLTNAPSSRISDYEAKELAKRLGAGFIAPHLAGLVTTDGAHLDSASSERWASAVFVELEPYIRDCVAR